MSKGNIKNYAKDKGFEIIPRGLLQHPRLSLQAIGLLCNLQSYPETWNLNKTEVYTRFPKNKKTSVANAWEELVEEKYIIQLRRREGKKWDYIYYFNLTPPFTNVEVQELENKESAKAMSFRFSEAQNEKPKMGSTKSADNRINIKDNTHKDNIHKNNTQDQNHNQEDQLKDYIESTNLPMGLKKYFFDQVKVLVNDPTFDIQSIEYFYNTYVQLIDSKCTRDDIDTLNDTEFTHTVRKMFKKVDRPIYKMESLLKEWVLSAIHYKKENFFDRN
ncbi:hypothetical protein JCM21714_2067 [Gracilibacillus boraciitolerans JCM 21714]|uniref:Uncharacterized protein n=1 Tax=Gracilibacillus boraciitolerans JCM 21714 TaxID=1298598 RepID=W4VIR5_9BACI|nr:hypothetical protein [Gracilibacillus boraciitolerans]GAE93036.1 hypothetical protein JCM21714_2067 [Gracilibacillus boraciitolerans JCM 21714]